MAIFGGLILIAAGVALRVIFTDPDASSVYPVSWLFIGSGTAGVIHDVGIYFGAVRVPENHV